MSSHFLLRDLPTSNLIDDIGQKVAPVATLFESSSKRSALQEISAENAHLVVFSLANPVTLFLRVVVHLVGISLAKRKTSGKRRMLSMKVTVCRWEKIVSSQAFDVSESGSAARPCNISIREGGRVGRGSRT